MRVPRRSPGPAGTSRRLGVDVARGRCSAAGSRAATSPPSPYQASRVATVIVVWRQWPGVFRENEDHRTAQESILAGEVRREGIEPLTRWLGVASSALRCRRLRRWSAAVWRVCDHRRYSVKVRGFQRKRPPKRSIDHPHEGDRRCRVDAARLAGPGNGRRPARLPDTASLGDCARASGTVTHTRAVWVGTRKAGEVLLACRDASRPRARCHSGTEAACH